ncbi:MAG: T9SS type A sorting domain-containing protein [Vicingaceae bacterium]|nr:T9SS type A sorting domain-containing protein [Vicingaceae bacterium]
MKKHLLSFILLSTASIAASAQCTEASSLLITTPVTTGYVAGQSFTAPCSGNISSIEVIAASVGTNAAGTLNIYAGNGTATTPIYTQAVGAITIANIGDPITVTITGNVAVTNASQYTFAMDMTLSVDAGSGYAGGEAFQSGTSVDPLDVDFEVDISAATSIDEIKGSTTTVYPNPATNVLNISTNEVIKSIEIYSVNGALVKTVSTKAIDISELNNGMYFLSVLTESGVTQTRFIKE